LADSFADVGLVAHYCSPILRAVRIAQIVGQRLNLTPEIEDGLRERGVGILEGQEISPENICLCWRITQQWMVYGNHDVRLDGMEKDHPGEGYNDIAARFTLFISRLEEIYRDTEASMLLISHGQTLAMMLPRLLSKVDWAFSSTHTFDGSFYATAELRDKKWICLRWGD
jgi:broad specificity phosphatase PhoE